MLKRWAGYERLSPRDKTLPVLGGKTDDFWLDQTLEVFVGHPYHFGVRAGIKGNLIVFGQRFGNINIQPVKLAKGWHRPGFAIGKHLLEIVLRGELDLVGASNFPQVLKDDFAIGRQDRHGHLAIELDDDSF